MSTRITNAQVMEALAALTARMDAQEGKPAPAKAPPKPERDGTSPWAPASVGTDNGSFVTVGCPYNPASTKVSGTGKSVVLGSSGGKITLADGTIARVQVSITRSIA